MSVGRKLNWGLVILYTFVLAVAINSAVALSTVGAESEYLKTALELNMLLLLAAGVLGVSGIFLIDTWVSKPLQALMDASEQIHRDALDLRIGISTQDEFGSLARAFNEAAERLNRYVDQLDEKRVQVSERSEALEERGRELNCLYSLAEVIGDTGTDLNSAAAKITRTLHLSWPDANFVKVSFGESSAVSGSEAQKSLVFRREVIAGDRALGEIAIGFREDSPRCRFINETDILMDEIAMRLGVFAENKTVEEQNRSLENRLRRAKKIEITSTVAGGVAHDLNNILTALLGYPEILLQDVSPQSEMYKPLKTMHEAAREAAVIVQDLLTLSRRGVSVSEPVRINDIILNHLNSAEHLEMMSAHDSVSVQLALGSRLPLIVGSSVHIAQAIMNLITNAAEAMPGGGEIQVITEHKIVHEAIEGYETIAAGEFIVITIQDQGTGISESSLRRIFEPFYTNKKMGRSGSGLGMAVVHGTVKDHDGFIDVDSTEGSGTRIRMYFPASADIDPVSRPKPDARSLRGEGEKILVVNSSEHQQDITSRILGFLGYEVFTASDGEEALVHLRQREFDLVILDVAMNPDEGSLATLQRIRSYNQRLPTIITSGVSVNERTGFVSELNTETYLRKPYTMLTIGEAVKNQLGA